MIKLLICLIIGHKKYSPHVLSGEDFMTMKDLLGVKLLTVNICERCKKLYVRFTP
jgi:hypothetical protein